MLFDFFFFFVKHGCYGVDEGLFASVSEFY